MSIVAKYTDYFISHPEYFIEHIQNEINLRDVYNISNKRFPSITVTGEHPLVALVGSILATQGTANFSGLLPSIAVIEGDDAEEITTVGQGKRETSYIDQPWIDQLKTELSAMKDRSLEGLLTDIQIQAIETALVATTTGKLKLEIDQFHERQSVFVSLWAHNRHERTLMGNLLRSVLYDMKKDMISKRLSDISIRTSKGLVNFNFGRILYGQESEISYLNSFKNYTVIDEEALDEGDSFEVDTEGKYKAESHLDQSVIIYEGEEE